MSFSFSKDFSSASFTVVENAFIKEYLPTCSGDAVKVYLYGLFLCTEKHEELSLSDFSQKVGLGCDVVADCLKFFEEFGLISIISLEPLTVNYLPVNSFSSAKPRKIKAEKYTDFSKSVQAIIPSRMISTGEYTEYFNVMETYGILPDAMLMIIKYCADLKGDSVSYRYVVAVAKNFAKEGITTVDQVERKLSSYTLFTGEIARILKAMSLRRQPEVEDLDYLKKWTKELCFETDVIEFAASKLKHGSIEKLDAFLMELYSIKSFSKGEIADYLAKKQQIYDLAVKINRALSIYVEVIDTEISTYVQKWISFGFTGDTLILVADYCFKEDKKSLTLMDEIINSLREQGLVDLTSVSDYFESIKAADKFISKLLLTAGVNRRPNAWDRNNLALWKSWNFSEDMILEAAKTAAGKSSPIPYVNGVLSNWKRDGVFTPEAITQNSESNGATSQENYNLEYERRRNKAVSRAQKNKEKALELEGFSEVYGRLNSIEKDLAFAMLGKDENLLNKLRDEKRELVEKETAMLSSIGLTPEDLFPKYACEKCNDTGYVGTKRCDCFNKKV